MNIYKKILESMHERLPMTYCCHTNGTDGLFYNHLLLMMVRNNEILISRVDHIDIMIKQKMNLSDPEFMDKLYNELKYHIDYLDIRSILNKSAMHCAQHKIPYKNISEETLDMLEPYFARHVVDDLLSSYYC